jgi:hypothetical protein
MSQTMIREVEQKIVRRFVKDALKAGYRLAVSLERGFDVEDMLLGSTDVEKIMNEAFAGDEAHIFVQPSDGPTVEDGQVVSTGWVFIVLGNDGYDVISDYTVNLESLLAGANQLAVQYE